MRRILLTLCWWLLFIGIGHTQSLTALQTDFTHATDCTSTSGATTARQGQKCIDLDDFTHWYCATPTGGASDTLCDEPDDWKSLATNFTGQPSGTDLNNQRSVIWTFTTGSTTSNPNFSNETGLELVFTAFHGQNDRDAAGKKTFFPLNISGQYYAMGQRFAYAANVDCWGMGDCFLSSDHVTSAAGVSDPGGEGTSFRTMQLTQLTTLTKTTISSIVARTTCSTTITQAITRNIAAQTVTVADNTGCVVGDWLTVERGQIYVSDGKIEGVKLTAVGTGTVTAIFRHSHLSGATLTPATVMTLASGSHLGEHRYLVNLTAAAVTAGTVSASVGTAFTGSGTAWSADMVGGDATLPGCIALTADDYTAAPFSVPNTLKSWYGIASVTDADTLNIAHRSAVGVLGYSGNGLGAYTIRPCARILTILTNAANTSLTNQIVLETNSFTWTASDSVEIAMSVDGDVTGELMRVAWWTPGAALRSVYNAWNNGAQRWDSAFRAIGSPTNLGDAFRAGISIEPDVDVGLELTGLTASGALNLQQQAAVDDKRIKWGTRIIGPPVTDNNGFTIQGTGTGGGGTLNFTIPASPDVLPILAFEGHMDLSNAVAATAQQPRLRFKQGVSTYLSFPMQSSGILGGRGLQGMTTDYLTGTRAMVEFLSNGSSAVTINSLNDAIAGTNYASHWMVDVSSVWNGSAATKTYFAHRTNPAAGTSGLVTWELRAGTNASFSLNPVRFSVREDGLVVVGAGGMQHLTGTRPTCDVTARGTTFYVAGGSGVLDTYELCRKDASNVYAWVSLL